MVHLAEKDVNLVPSYLKIKPKTKERPEKEVKFIVCD
jgi:hypothetical protein